MEESLIARLESAVVRLESLSSGFAGGGASVVSRDGDSASDPSILAFDDLMEQYMSRVSSTAETIGGQVLEASKVLREAFSVQRELLMQIKKTQKPDNNSLPEFLKPLNEVIMKANAMTEGKRSDFFNHLKALADSLSALAWIAYTGKNCGMSMPTAHVEESWQAAEFYSNKVRHLISAEREPLTSAQILVEYKSKDPNHVEWAKALKELYLPGLRDYVKSHYPLGPVWNATGEPFTRASSKASCSSSPAAPPPPPPQASLSSFESSQPSSSQPKGMAAVFQEINSGSGTAGLRKVTDDMKSKNRADRSGVVGSPHTSSPCTSSPRVTSPRTRSLSKTGPPRLELQMGRKWVVENQMGRKDLVIDNCDSKQSVYVFGCEDSVLQILGKVNNITIDKCNKMGLVFIDVVAACEIVNCNGVEVQCQGSAPSISVDNTSGCQLYLSKYALGASITTAKCTEINVLVPGDGDWAEHALPQQFVHEFKDGQFLTTPVSHSAGG